MRRLTKSTNSVQEQPNRPKENIGATLAMVRKGQGLSLEEVGQELKIHSHHLEALERGDFDSLPNPYWARGLLIRYADHLSLEGEELAEKIFPSRRPPGPARYLPRRWPWFAALGAISVVAVVAIVATLLPGSEEGLAGKIKDSLHSLAPGVVLASEPQRVVVLGSGGAGITGAGNVMTFEIDQDDYEVSSIPVTTSAEVPGHGKKVIGEVADLGGPDLTRQTVARLTKSDVQHYLMIGPEGIKEIADEIGGVKVKVPNRITGKASIGGPKIRLNPGTQTLNGDQILVYLQGQDLSGDEQMIERQQEVLFAMFEQALGPGQLLSNPPTVSTLLRRTETNISPIEAVQLAVRLESLRSSDTAKNVSVEPTPE